MTPELTRTLELLTIVANQHVVNRDHPVTAIESVGRLLHPRQRRSFSLATSHSAAVKNRFRHDWFVISANSRLTPDTLFRSAIINPARYSPKCRRFF